jgi:hypothetical protein
MQHDNNFVNGRGGILSCFFVWMVELFISLNWSRSSSTANGFFWYIHGFDKGKIKSWSDINAKSFLECAWLQPRNIRNWFGHFIQSAWALRRQMTKARHTSCCAALCRVSQLSFVLGQIGQALEDLLVVLNTSPTRAGTSPGISTSTAASCHCALWASPNTQRSRI